MKRQLGLLAVVVTVVGYVIGASIFVLPGQLAGEVGPAVVLAYAVAAVIAVFACLAAAILGSMFPKTGAGYVAISQLLSPVAGFITTWLMLAVYVLAIALIAYGFADYFVRLFPQVDESWAAYGVVLFFGLINLAKARNLVKVQTILVILFMLALVAVSFGGVLAIDKTNIIPFIPTGFSPVLSAVVPAFFSYGGFMVVMELAGEIKKPSRTIPLGLALSFVVVLATYISLSLALVGSINWRELATLNAPVSHLATLLFGHWGGVFVAIAAVGAAATSINALVLVASRDIVALANSGVFSPRLADNSQGQATNSVIIVTIFALISLALGDNVLQYAIWVSAMTLVYQVIIGAALLKIPSKASQAYQQAEFKLGIWGTKACGLGMIIISAIFIFIVFQQSPERSIAAIVYLAIGLTYYFIRQKQQSAVSYD
jgi:APA family basic amino acid/polyamine antiporter